MPRTPVRILAVVVALVAGILAPGTPAAAAPVVEPRAIALDVSATCERGNVNISYAATDVDRQLVDFTSESGVVLDLFDTAAYASDFDGTEYVLTKAGSNRGGNQPVPEPGTILGVYVTVGTSPPTAGNGEFFLLYRCDDQRNDRGGTNEVLETCVGPFGSCPRTAVEALDPAPPTTPAPPPTPTSSTPDGGTGVGPASGEPLRPTFTG